MSEVERQLYVAVTEATRQFAWRHGINDGFLLATPQRQVTSSPAAIAAAWLAGGVPADELIDDVRDDFEDDQMMIARLSRCVTYCRRPFRSR